MAFKLDTFYYNNFFLRIAGGDLRVSNKTVFVHQIIFYPAYISVSMADEYARIMARPMDETRSFATKKSSPPAKRHDSIASAVAISRNSSLK